MLLQKFISFSICLLCGDAIMETGSKDQLGPGIIINELKQLWSSLHAGDVEDVVGHYSKDYEMLLNGDRDQTLPWQNLTFVQSLLSSIMFSEMNMLSPITPIGKNTVMVNTIQKCSSLRTGETIHLGPFSRKFVFNDENKIVSEEIIGREHTMQHLSSIILGPSFDMKAGIDQLITAYNSQDLDTIHDLLSHHCIIKRNGRVTESWKNSEFLSVLFSAVDHKKIVADWAISGHNTILLNIYNSVQVKSSGLDISFYDAWVVAFNAKAEMIQIDIVVDLSHIISMERAIMQSRKKHDEL